MSKRSVLTWNGREIAEGWKAEAILGAFMALLWLSGLVTGCLIGGAA